MALDALGEVLLVAAGGDLFVEELFCDFSSVRREANYATIQREARRNAFSILPGVIQCLKLALSSEKNVRDFEPVCTLGSGVILKALEARRWHTPQAENSVVKSLNQSRQHLLFNADNF